MSDLVVEFLKQANITQLIAIGIMIWYFYNRLDIKIEKRFIRLEDKVEDIDRRLCRIEGSLSTQGHCLFNQEKQEKKAQ